jgi:mRNA deadenylase 3'-5' endonuclease subunit Ccr4
MFRKPSLKVRVVSYNVLSSHLASPSHFVTLNPAHLESIARLPVVLQKLDSELDAHSNVIVCLQEVSYDWLGKFHAYFANRGYHMVSANYGRKFNGYMGKQKRIARMCCGDLFCVRALPTTILSLPFDTFSIGPLTVSLACASPLARLALSLSLVVFLSQASCWRGP